MFQLKIFSQSQKFGKYAKNHKIWLLHPQKEWGWGDRLDPDLKLLSGVSGTSVQNFRSPAQSARSWPFLVVIVILFLFVVALVIIKPSKRDITELIGRSRIAFPS